MKTKSLKIISLCLIGIYFIILLFSIFYKIPSILLNPLTFIIILIILFLTLIFSNEKNNYLKLLSNLLLALFLGSIISRLTIMPQNKYNRQKANELIVEVESFIIKNNRNPKKNEIELPKAVNGISISDFDYFFMDSKDQVYYIKYSNGLLDDYVYNSLSKTWFLDD